MKNKYGFLNNKFILVIYTIKYNEVFEDETIERIEEVLTDKQLEIIKARLDKDDIKYTIETIDNSSIAWIKDTEIDNNLIEKAIELGEDDFYEYLYENDDNAQRDISMIQILNALKLEGEILEKAYERLDKNKSVSKKHLLKIKEEI